MKRSSIFEEWNITHINSLHSLLHLFKFIDELKQLVLLHLDVDSLLFSLSTNFDYKLNSANRPHTFCEVAMTNY